MHQNFATPSSLIGSILLVFIFVGCETTDYEPLMVKQQLKKLTEENMELKQRVNDLENQLLVAAKTRNQAGTDGSTGNRNDSVAQVEPERPSIDQLALANEMSNKGVYVGVDDSGQRIVELDFTDAVYSNDDLSAVTELPDLKTLVLNGVNCDQQSFELVGKMPVLQHLEIPMSPATPEALAELTGLQNLKFIQLFRADVTDDGFKELAKIDGLQQIRCAQTRISNDALKNISSLESLKALDLSDCNLVNDSGLLHLTKVPDLRFLKLWGPGITNAGMQHVGRMNSLQVLGLNDTGVTDDGVAELAGLNNLREVHLFRTSIGDDGLKVLAELPNMQLFNLRDTKISDAAISHLLQRDMLTSLDLSETQSPGITDAGGKLLSGFKNLTRLNLWDTNVSDNSVVEIAKLENLVWLNLDKTDISDKAIPDIARLGKLTWLHVGSTALTDASVDMLKSMEQLQYLNVSNTQMSQERFFELFDHLSALGCEVVGP